MLPVAISFVGRVCVLREGWFDCRVTSPVVQLKLYHQHPLAVTDAGIPIHSVTSDSRKEPTHIRALARLG